MSQGHNRTPVRTGSGSCVQETPLASPAEDLWLEVLPCPTSGRAGQIASCPLDPGATAPGAARDFTRQILGSWGLLVLAEDAAVIVSELVTNALRHGVRDTNGPGHDRVELILLRRPGQMLCAVTDPGAEPPVLAAPDLSAEAGRGLHVIEALAAAWGWTRLDASNKAVWAALSVSGADGAAAADSTSSLLRERCPGISRNSPFGYLAAGGADGTGVTHPPGAPACRRASRRTKVPLDTLLSA
jgi:anti-sigma regulatory factor (Ser/Thr protein kinase)